MIALDKSLVITYRIPLMYLWFIYAAPNNQFLVLHRVDDAVKSS
jgi:hypothetical protein